MVGFEVKCNSEAFILCVDILQKVNGMNNPQSCAKFPMTVTQV